MTTLFHLFRLRPLLILAVLLCTFPALSAQEAEEMPIQTKKKSSNTAQTSAQKAALEAEKNTNNLRKINLLLTIAQDRDRQAGEETEAIRSSRLRIEEDLADAEDTRKSLSKKETRRP